MNKVVILLFFFLKQLQVCSQPVDYGSLINLSAISKSFLELVHDEKWTNLQAQYIDSEKEKGVKDSIDSDYNSKLKQLADSTMKRIFGETGFSKNFTMACLQNPCATGYLYANTLISNNPCASEPQDSCKEAIVTYNFVKKEVPLTIKMLITLKGNGEIVYIENNPYGLKEIGIEKQNLLSISEIQKIITKKFPKEHLTILAANKPLVYAHTRILRPKTKVKEKMKSRTKKILIRETKAGKNWENGFIYTTQSDNSKKPKRIYQFDAVTGKLLWITEIYKVTNENNCY
jgi:hypothetical protein